jgi:hypothetical protein
MGQLHLANAEPDLVDDATKFQIQMRRRVFWSAYALDRAVGTAFNLPFSIPDYQITVRLYANTDDYELDDRSSEDLQVSRALLASHSLSIWYIAGRSNPKFLILLYIATSANNMMVSLIGGSASLGS